jgi:hypothetical protein
MVPLLRALLIFALASAAMAADADPPGRVGRLNHISGPISFAAAGAPDEWSAAVLNRPLTSGDRLWADRGVRGELHVGSTAVRFAPLTQLDLLHLDDDGVQLRLTAGVLNIRVRELDPDERIEIATPAGAAALREPGSYRISYDPATELTHVSVYFGEAEVLTPSQSVLVPPAQIAVVPIGGPIGFAIAGHAGEFDSWSAERDRREDHVASTRYVSSYMTGYEDLDHYGTWRSVPEYGAVWVPARVAPGWAPYRYGRWVWVSPWGWTWIDDAPWGFAPFHYGRWVWMHDHWGWAPGPLLRRPVYAPALVAFVGGPRGALSVAHGPAVGWFPLGWRETFHPWYRASHRHIRNVNVAHVPHGSAVHNHLHRHRAHAVTVVPHRSFVSGARPSEARLALRQADLAGAQILRDRPPAERPRREVAPNGPAHHPHARAAARNSAQASPPPDRFRGHGPGAPRTFVPRQWPSAPAVRQQFPQAQAPAGVQQPGPARRASREGGGWGHDRTRGRKALPGSTFRPSPGLVQQHTPRGERRGDGRLGASGRSRSRP